MKSFGFSRVEFDASFDALGWASILDEEDWKHDRGKELDKLAKAVRELQKAGK